MGAAEDDAPLTPVRNGAQCLTTNSDISFMTAQAGRVTGELRKAMEQ